jgi:rod shape-determining protein MreD
MRWISFILGALVVLTLQSVLGPRLQIAGARPDLLLVYVLFFALYGRRLHAVVGAWGIGAVADLMTVERAGLLSLTYFAAAAMVTLIRDSVFRYESVTQFAVVQLTGLVVQIGWLGYRIAIYPAFDPPWGTAAVGALAAAAYTALLAPLLYRLLLRAPALFGLPRTRYAYGMSSDAEDHRV